MSATDEDPLSVLIVRAIADAEGVSPDELEFRLQEWVDVDALQALDDHDGEDWSLQFRVDEYEVTVTSDRTVHVDRTRSQ